jgi:hypothetical protein
MSAYRQRARSATVEIRVPERVVHARGHRRAISGHLLAPGRRYQNGISRLWRGDPGVLRAVHGAELPLARRQRSRHPKARRGVLHLRRHVRLCPQLIEVVISARSELR